MPRLRPYADGDWKAVLDLCLRAFAPACESLERVLGTDLDWRTSIRRHLRTLTRSAGSAWLLVVELRGTVVGVVHYQVDRDTRGGSIGLSAVHPDRQGQGIGSLMYRHVLGAMRRQRARYATAEAGGDWPHAAARRAYEKVGFASLPMVHYVIGLGDSRPAAARRGQGAVSRQTKRQKR